MKPLRLERGRLEIYRTLKLTTAPFPNCKFTQLELTSRSSRFLRVFTVLSLGVDGN